MLQTANDESKIFSGLQVGNINEIHSKFICVQCNSLIYHPHQLLCCGSLGCLWCLMEALSDRFIYSIEFNLNCSSLFFSEPFICPFCHTTQVKKQISPDRGVQRELNKIIVSCYACIWKGFYIDYLVIS